MRVPGVGGPRRVIGAAIAAMEAGALKVEAVSPIIASAPLGPSLRRYANACVVLTTELAPPAVLVRLQAIERTFGRRNRGQRWRARPLDLDIVLWNGGVWSEGDLTVPHRAFRERSFVLEPARAIVADWRDPLTGFSLSHLHARLTRPRPLPR